MKLSVISPVYKAASCIEELHSRISGAILSIQNVTDYEIIFVEDCGGDGSWEKICELSRKDPHLKAVQLSRNFGQHHALTAGIELSSGDWIFVLDCDLQDPPEDIPRLLSKAQEGYDMVCARRGKRKDPLWKRFTSRLFIWLLNWLSGMEHDPEVANFRVFSKVVRDAYCNMPEQISLMGAHLKWLGFNTGFIDIQHSKRFEGKSSYTLRKLFHLALNAIVAYSNKPLRMSVTLGFCLTLGSFLYAVYIAFKKVFIGVPIDGWSSLMVSLWFIGGIIIANLGIIGIYLGKVYDEAKRRPLYVIARKVNC